MAGQPPKYKSAQDLQDKIDQYFESGMRTRTVIVGSIPKQKEIQVTVPIITDLALYLGFCSRQSFYDQEKREGFSYTIKRARLRIESEYEFQLNIGNTIGAIFALKNMGWTDKMEQSITIHKEHKIFGPLTPEGKVVEEAIIDN